MQLSNVRRLRLISQVVPYNSRTALQLASVVYLYRAALCHNPEPLETVEGRRQAVQVTCPIVQMTLMFP